MNLQKALQMMAAERQGGMKGLGGLVNGMMQQDMMKQLFGDLAGANPMANGIPNGMAPPPPQAAPPGGQGSGMITPNQQPGMAPTGQPQGMPPLQKPNSQTLGQFLGGSGAPSMGQVNPTQMGNHQTSLGPPPGGPDEYTLEEKLAPKHVVGGEFPDPNAPPDPMAGVGEDHNEAEALLQQLQYWEQQPDSAEKAQALEDIRMQMEQIGSN